MKKNVNIIKISLNKTKKNSLSKKDLSKASNRNNLLSKEKNSYKNNFIFNKNNFVNKNLIPNSNSKCYIKINNKLKQENKNKILKLNNNSFSKKLQLNIKNKNLSLDKKIRNNSFRVFTQRKKSHEKNNSFIRNKKESNLFYNNSSLNSQRLLRNKYNIKSNKMTFDKNKLNNSKKNTKIFQIWKNKEESPIYHKKIDKNHKLLLINKIKNNIINISSDKIRKNLNYYKRKNNIISNNSQIMKNIKDNIYLNSKEIKIRNIYYPKSPKNRLIIFKNNISPIKKANKKNEEKINDNIIKNSKASSIFTVFNFDKKFPDNYKFHEIIYKNSPKNNISNNNIKEEAKNNFNGSQKNLCLRNKHSLLEELTSQNKNYNRISTTILINNQSFNNLDNKILIPYYCTLNSNKNISLRNSFKEDNYNTSENICFCSNDNFNRSKNNSKLFLSPNSHKSDLSSQYNDIETENEDTQMIHFFGEEMLKKNKNYNFPINNEIYKFPINVFKNSELKRNNSSNDINNLKISNKKKLYQSIPLSYSFNEFKWRKFHKRNENKFRDVPINKKNNRYSHNIINRKKKKKLVMEKSLNEQFISQCNKCKSNDNTKDKISCIESSINLDNDSINEIIKEFEKEIEDEEKKYKANKKSNKNEKINNGENIDGFIFSFISDNDNFSNMSKGSTNSSKIKNKRVRYYKTKNYELEKNIDFYINPTRIRINKK